MKKNKIVLLPNLLSESLAPADFLPENLKLEIDQLDGIIAESRKSAIRYLLKFIDREKANSLPILLLNEHTDEKELSSIFSEVKGKGKWGLMSDAGLPCIADPGAKIVSLAHKHNIELKAISGPCSITHGLMLSGFSGQRFAFNGYLPRKEDELIVELQKLEKRAAAEKSTQVFIEAPYRSDKLLKVLISALSDGVMLFVGADLTMPTESVYSFNIKRWKKEQITLGKRACIFLFQVN